MKSLFALKTGPRLTGLLIALSLALAACSPSAGYSGPANAAAPSPSPASGAETVRIAKNPQFGEILVTTDGKALYTNTADTPDTSKCTDAACTGFWQPYTVNVQPTAAEGLPGSLVTITRPDGSKQVTYNGQPLYTFYLDRQPGDAGGDGLRDSGGTWHIAALNRASGASSGNAGSGGYRYP